MPKIVKQSTKNKTKPKKKGGSTLAGMQSAWDFVDGIKMLIYGRSGTGKTTLWSSFPGPILALICSGGRQPGELRSINTPELRKKITPVIVEESTQIRDVLSEVEDFGTVVLDHGTGLQDLILSEILGIDELPAQKSWGMASREDYGTCTLQCKEIFRALLSLPQNVVIVAQERNFNEDSGSEMLAPTVGASLTPSLTGWLNPACDYVVQTFIRPKLKEVETKVGKKVITKMKRTKGVDYCLRTEPHEIFTTKFRVPKGNPLPDVIVNPTYEKINALINP